MSYGILLLRMVLGLTLASHGAQKLFGWFDGHGPRGTAGFFGQLGFRAPLVMAAAAGLSEFGGGLLLAMGLLTPLAALAITVVMLTAIWTVHRPKGFWAMSGGYEYNLLIWASAVALAATGGGRYSLDAAIGWAGILSDLWWGLGVAAGGVLLAAANLAFGRGATAPEAPAGPTEAEEQPPAEPATAAADREAESVATAPAMREHAEVAERYPPVEIEVADAGEGNDLVDCLWRHGFTATLMEDEGGWRVDVHSRLEEPDRLMFDLVAPVETWLRGREHAGLVLAAGELRYTVKAQDDR